MILLSIRDIVVGFADQYGLNAWDWIALTITLTTLIVSLLTLAVARKTLKSQEQTEKNTTPDINPDIQFSLFEKFSEKYFNSVFRLYAFYYAENETNFRTKPSKWFWSSFTDPEKYLFESVYYGDLNKFSIFKDYIDRCSAFNKGIERLELLFEKNASEIEIEQEFVELAHCIDLVIDLSVRLLLEVFGKTKTDVIAFFNKIGVFPKKLTDVMSNWVAMENIVRKDQIIPDDDLSFREKQEEDQIIGPELFDYFLRFITMVRFTMVNYSIVGLYDERNGFLDDQLSCNLRQRVKREIGKIEYNGEPFTYFVFKKKEYKNEGFPFRLYKRYEYILLDIEE